PQRAQRNTEDFSLIIINFYGKALTALATGSLLFLAWVPHNHSFQLLLHCTVGKFSCSPTMSLKIVMFRPKYRTFRLGYCGNFVWSSRAKAISHPISTTQTGRPDFRSSCVRSNSFHLGKKFSVVKRFVLPSVPMIVWESHWRVRKPAIGRSKGTGRWWQR